jgi:hypothetical protein
MHGSGSLEGYAQHKRAGCTEDGLKLLRCCYSAYNGFVTIGLLDHRPNFLRLDTEHGEADRAIGAQLIGVGLTA